jgi:hypothetical protein
LLAAPQLIDSCARFPRSLVLDIARPDAAAG